MTRSSVALVDWKSVGGEVARARGRLQMGRQALATRAGVSDRTVRRLEAGRAVSFESLARLEKALELPVGTLTSSPAASGARSKGPSAMVVRSGGEFLDLIPRAYSVSVHGVASPEDTEQLLKFTRTFDEYDALETSSTSRFTLGQNLSAALAQLAARGWALTLRLALHEDPDGSVNPRERLIFLRQSGGASP
jgi:transcriptional regulator with XRE-family HTH domain